tara:strand:- start:8138 stop:10144 length:2007 start_codon:yes stop_codon:yes gene_type:complete
MADSYSVDIGDAGASYAQGVTYPSATEMGAAAAGINALSKGLFGVLDGMTSTSKQPSEGSINRQLYAEFSKELDGLKGSGDLNVRTGLNGLITKYSKQGLKIDENVSRLVKVTTGVDVDYLNVDPYQESLNMMNQKLSENPAYVFLARDKLLADGVENPTDSAVLEKAISLIAQQETASLVISNANTMSAAEFTQNETMMINTLENTRELGLKALSIEIAGGNVSPESLQQLKGQIQILKGKFIQPRGVSDQEFQGIQKRIDRLDELVQFVTNYDTEILNKLKGDTLNKVDLAIVKQLEATDVDLTLQRAILGNLDKLSEVVLNKSYPEVVAIMKGVSGDDIGYEALEVFENLPNDLNIEDSESSLNTTTELHTSNSITKVEEMSDKARISNLDYSITFEILALEASAMQSDENARNLLLKGIDRSALIAATTDLPLDLNMLFDPKKGLFSNKTFELLKAVKPFNPDGVEVAKRQLLNALQEQSNRFFTAMSGVTQTSVFEIKEKGTIGFKTTGPKPLRDGTVQAFADEHYGGNIFRMIKDDFSKLENSEKTELRGKGFDTMLYSNHYKEITDINQMSSKYSEAWRKLGGDPTKFEGMKLIAQEKGTTQIGPSEELESGPATSRKFTQENPFTFTEGMSNKDAEAAFNNLPSGSFFIDPDDGMLYEKQ